MKNMKLKILYSLFIIISLLLSIQIVHSSSTQDQIVELEPVDFEVCNFNKNIGETIEIDVMYRASNDNKFQTAFGCQIHFNSQELTFDDSSMTFPNGKLGDLSQTSDDENSDKDDNTDSKIVIAYTNISSGWPKNYYIEEIPPPAHIVNIKYPLRLIRLKFQIKEKPKSLNITQTAGDEDYGFIGRGLVIGNVIIISENRGNSTIKPHGYNLLDCGTNQYFSINVKDSACDIRTVNVNGKGEEDRQYSSYDFIELDENQTIESNSKFKEYLITVKKYNDANEIIVENKDNASCGKAKTISWSPPDCLETSEVFVNKISKTDIITNDSYTIQQVKKDYIVEIYFKKKQHNIIVSSSDDKSECWSEQMQTGCTITNKGNKIVDCGTSLTCDLSCPEKSKIVDIVVDDISKGPISTYTFSQIKDDHTIKAIFGCNPRKVIFESFHKDSNEQYMNSPTLDDNYSFEFDVLNGQSYDQKIQLNPGYLIDYIIINSKKNDFDDNNNEINIVLPDKTILKIIQDKENIQVYSFNFDKITSNHNIKIHVKKIKHRIITKVNGPGCIKHTNYTSTCCNGYNTCTSESEVLTYYNSVHNFKFEPSDCYEINDVIINGESNGVIDMYRTPGIKQDYTIEVYFTRKEFVFNSYLNDESKKFAPKVKIQPENGTKIKCGFCQDINIDLDQCYNIPNLLLNDRIIEPFSYSRICDIRENIKIELAVEQKKYSITADSGNNGIITPDGIIEKFCGAKQIIQFTPDECKVVDDVKVDGISQGSISSYTFDKVTKDQSIYVSFKDKYLDINISMPEHGTITPKTKQKILCNNSLMFEIIPDENYVLNYFSIDEKKYTSANANGYTFTNIGDSFYYTLTNIKNDHEIRANFKPFQKIILKATDKALHDDSFSVTVVYDVSVKREKYDVNDKAYNSNGIGFDLHFDSSKIKYEDLVGRLKDMTDFNGDSKNICFKSDNIEILDETPDIQDNDKRTDKVLRFLYKCEQWPGEWVIKPDNTTNKFESLSLPVNLAVFKFKYIANEYISTAINVTPYYFDPDFGFKSENATINTGPAIESITPTQGTIIGGTNVIINGYNLNTITNVYVDGNEINKFDLIDINSRKALQFKTPNHVKGQAPVKLVNQKSESDSINYTYVNYKPVMTDIDDQEIDEEQTNIIKFNVSDTEGSNLTFNVSSSNTGMIPADIEHLSLCKCDNTDCGIANNYILQTEPESDQCVQLSITPEIDKTGSTKISLSVNDNDTVNTNFKTFSLTVKNVNDPPKIEGSNEPVLYDAKKPIKINSIKNLTDVDDTHIEQAIISINNCISSEDILYLRPDQKNYELISSNFTNSNCTLKLSGSDLIENYITALNSIEYSNSNATPDNSTRNIQITVNDGKADSNQITNEILIRPLFAPPVISKNNIEICEDTTANINIKPDEYDINNVKQLKFSNIKNGNLSCNNSVINNDDFIDISNGSIDCTYTPALNSFGEFEIFSVQSASDNNIGYSAVCKIKIYPHADKIVVNDANTNQSEITGNEIKFSKNESDFTEVSNIVFKNITNCNLYNGNNKIENNTPVLFNEPFNVTIKQENNNYNTINFSVQGLINEEYKSSICELQGTQADIEIKTPSEPEIAPNSLICLEDNEIEITISPSVYDISNSLPTSHVKISDIKGGTLKYNDKKINNNDFIKYNNGSVKLIFTPNSNLHSKDSNNEFSFYLQSAINEGNKSILGKKKKINIDVTPVADDIQIPPEISIDEDTFYSIEIKRSEFDSTEVKYFKFSEITSNVSLGFSNKTISEGDFVEIPTDGSVKIDFIPSANFHTNNEKIIIFKVQGYISKYDSNPGPVTECQISIKSKPDIPVIDSQLKTDEDTPLTIAVNVNSVDINYNDIKYFLVTNLQKYGKLKINGNIINVNIGIFVPIDENNNNKLFEFIPDKNRHSKHNLKFGFDIQASNSNNESAVLSEKKEISIYVKPLPDSPAVETGKETPEEVETSVKICRNSIYDTEVTHFQFNEIQGGTIYDTKGNLKNNDSKIVVQNGCIEVIFEPEENLNSSDNLNKAKFNVRSLYTDLETNNLIYSDYSTVMIKVNPIPDILNVTDQIETCEDEYSDIIRIARNENDGDEVSHFKISNIKNGRVFIDNTGYIIENDSCLEFDEQGISKLKFIPKENKFGPSTDFGFFVQGSLTSTCDNLGSIKSVKIKVNPVADPLNVPNEINYFDIKKSGLLVELNNLDLTKNIDSKVKMIQIKYDTKSANWFTDNNYSTLIPNEGTIELNGSDNITLWFQSIKSASKYVLYVSGIANNNCTSNKEVEINIINEIPEIREIQPTQGGMECDTQVTIFGNNFDIYNGVKISSGPLAAKQNSINVESTSKITCIIGNYNNISSENVSVDVSVENINGLSGKLTDGFNFIASPVINNITPSIAYPKTPIAIYGTNLEYIENIEFGTMSIQPRQKTTTQLIFDAPDLASGAISVTVVDKYQQKSNRCDNCFEYPLRKPVFDPDSTEISDIILTIKLSCETGKIEYYFNDTQYSEISPHKITISKNNSIVKARCVEDGYVESDWVTRIYTTNKPPSMVDCETKDKIEELNKTLSENETVDINLCASDPDGDSSNIKWKTDKINCILNNYNEGEKNTVSYTPPVNFNGNDTCTITIEDNQNGITDFKINFVVTDKNSTPYFSIIDPIIETYEDTSNLSKKCAENISPGAPDETNQRLNFVITEKVQGCTEGLLENFPIIQNSNNEEYFQGTENEAYIHIKPLKDANGQCTYEVRLHDSGKGDDTSTPQEVTIIVKEVNDPPQLTLVSKEPIIVYNNNDTNGKNPYNELWAKDINPGPDNEASQKVTISTSIAAISTSNDNLPLFDSDPYIDQNGRLLFTPNQKNTGNAEIKVILEDNGGRFDGGNNTSTYYFDIEVIQKMYLLEIKGEGKGEEVIVNKEDTISLPFPYTLNAGLNVEIEAKYEKDDYWTFDKWIEDDKKHYANPLKFTMDKNKTIKLVSKERQKLLCINGNGQIKVNGEIEDLQNSAFCKEYIIGTDVEIEALNNFDYFTDDLEGSNPTQTITMNNNKKITAHFKDPFYWKLDILNSLSSDKNMNNLSVGVSSSAYTETFNSEPSCSLVSMNDNFQKFVTDIRKDNGNFYKWDIRIYNIDCNADFDIRWNPDELSSFGEYLLIIKGETINMRDNTSYRIKNSDTEIFATLEWKIFERITFKDKLTLFSIPVKPESNNISDLFLGLNTIQFLTYTPCISQDATSCGLQDTKKKIFFGKGYWIPPIEGRPSFDIIGRPQQSLTINLKKDFWYLIGSLHVDSVISDDSTCKLKAIFGYEKTYNLIDKNNFVLEPFKAYWVLSEKDGDLIIVPKKD